MTFGKANPIRCIGFMMPLIILGCRPANQGPAAPTLPPDYRKAVESAARVIPEAVEMERLFGRGEVDHFIEHFGMDSARWDSEVYFGGRYSLTMQVDISVDHRQHVIRPKGEPVFYLVEYHRIDILDDGRAHGHTGSPAGLAKHDFSSDQWDLFYKSGGDLAVLGVKENTNPVPHFDEHAHQVRRNRVPVVSLLPADDPGNRKAAPPGNDSKAE